MDNSERFERYKYSVQHDEWTKLSNDEKLSRKILELLNHPDLNERCMVDAYYYDFSVIPSEIIDKFDIRHDAYLIYGITTKGELISKWVDRWDLDSY